MKATLAEPEIVRRQGKPVSAIVPIKDYEELLQRVEDAGDVVLQEIWRIKDKLSASHGHEMDPLRFEPLGCARRGERKPAERT